MSGPLVWWQNRKSRMGMKPSAKAPPHLPGGKGWWTSPPTTAPMPEHVEYVASFMAELIGTTCQTSRQQKDHNALVKYTADWLKAARRLLHEEQCAPGRADLLTTDGLIIAASTALHRMQSRIYGLGGTVDREITEVVDAVQGRADKLRRERAMKTAFTAKDPSK